MPAVSYSLRLGQFIGLAIDHHLLQTEISLMVIDRLMGIMMSLGVA